MCWCSFFDIHKCTSDLSLPFLFGNFLLHIGQHKHIDIYDELKSAHKISHSEVSVRL